MGPSMSFRAQAGASGLQGYGHGRVRLTLAGWPHGNAQQLLPDGGPRGVVRAAARRHNLHATRSGTAQGPGSARRSRRPSCAHQSYAPQSRPLLPYPSHLQERRGYHPRPTPRPPSSAAVPLRHANATSCSYATPRHRAIRLTSLSGEAPMSARRRYAAASMRDMPSSNPGDGVHQPSSRSSTARAHT
jgi:hypothetical protein